MSTENANPNHPNAASAPVGHGGVTSHDTETAPEQKPIKAGHGLTAIVIFVLILVVLAVLGILPRRHAMEVLAQRTNELAAPSVIALAPKPGEPIQDLALPGNVTSYTDAPIYARTSGYLTRWYFDIGAKVKKGALLAEIASPEVDQQLAQAEADLNTAEANANNAKIQADRYKGLVASNAVSQQDTDTFTNQASSTAAQVKSAQANVQRLKELTAFEKVYAPFDGVCGADQFAVKSFAGILGEGQVDGFAALDGGGEDAGQVGVDAQGLDCLEVEELLLRGA